MEVFWFNIMIDAQTKPIINLAVLQPGFEEKGQTGFETQEVFQEGFRLQLGQFGQQVSIAVEALGESRQKYANARVSVALSEPGARHEWDLQLNEQAVGVLVLQPRVVSGIRPAAEPLSIAVLKP